MTTMATMLSKAKTRASAAANDSPSVGSSAGAVVGAAAVDAGVVDAGVVEDACSVVDEVSPVAASSISDVPDHPRALAPTLGMNTSISARRALPPVSRAHSPCSPEKGSYCWMVDAL